MKLSSYKTQKKIYIYIYKNYNYREAARRTWFENRSRRCSKRCSKLRNDVEIIENKKLSKKKKKAKLELLLKYLHLNG